MIRTIDVIGCFFEVDYDWNERIAQISAVSIEGNDLTDYLTDKAMEKIQEAVNDKYADDMADIADYMYQINKESRWAA